MHLGWSRPFFRAAYSGLVVAAGVALQLISLGLLMERFYA